MNNNIQKIEVITELGQIIVRKENIKNNQYLFDIRNNIDGIYFLKVTNDENEISYRKIILKKKAIKKNSKQPFVNTLLDSKTKHKKRKGGNKF